MAADLVSQSLEDPLLQKQTLAIEDKIKNKKDTLEFLIFLDGDQSWSAAKTLTEPPFDRFIERYANRFHVLVAIGPETTCSRAFTSYAKKYPSFVSLLLSSRRTIGSLKNNVDVCLLSEAFRLDILLGSNQNIKFCMVSDDVTVGLACRERLIQLGRKSKAISPRRHLAYWLHGSLKISESIKSNGFVRVFESVLKEDLAKDKEITAKTLDDKLTKITEALQVPYSDRLRSETQKELLSCGYKLSVHKIDKPLILEDKQEEILQCENTAWYDKALTIVRTLLKEENRVYVSRIAKILKKQNLYDQTIKLKIFFGKESVLNDLDATFNKGQGYLQRRMGYDCQVCERYALNHDENGFCAKEHLDKLILLFDKEQTKELYMNKLGMVLPIPDFARKKVSWTDLLSDPYAYMLKLDTKRSQGATIIYYDFDPEQAITRPVPKRINKEKSIAKESKEGDGLSSKVIATRLGFDVGTKVLYRSEAGQITNHNGGTRSSPKVRVELASGVVVYTSIRKLILINTIEEVS